jgi:cell division protein FtsQ
MKRPEGFDRIPGPPRPSTDESSTARRGAVGRPTASTSTAEPIAVTEAPARTQHVDREPARLDAPTSTPAEARRRSRDARRLARRAAAARRAVERTEVRRFTRRTRHRRAAWIAAGAVTVVLVGSVVVSVFSPLLSLQTITIEGTSRVDRTAVLASLDGQLGKPLALVDFSAVKKDLSEFPLIESYVTETLPPHTLVVRITERQPIASVRVGKSFELVDPAGVVIATSTARPAGYPVVDIKGATVDGKVYRSTAEVLLALPASLRQQVTSVSASTADDVALTLKTGEQVVWGSAAASDQKARLLAGLIRDHAIRNPAQSVQYDVSAPDNSIIRAK